MANTYKPTSVVGEHYFGAEEFDAEFAPAEERDWVDAGHLELVPRTYRVLSDNYTGGEQGSEIEAALLVEIEAALVSGGVLERVDKKPAPKKPAAKKAAEKTAKKE
jgi:hypothetical protein